MSTSVTRKVGDTDDWEITVGHAGAADPLENASTVVLYMRKDGASTNKIDGTAVDSFTAAGAVVYKPTAADVNAAGLYWAYLLATYSDGTEARFPSAGYYPITLESNYEG